MEDSAPGLDLGEELTWDPIRLVPPEPWVGHLPFAYWIVKVLRPNLLVELGTHSGNSYFAFCQALAAFAPAAHAYAIDTWQGDQHSGLYGDEVFEDVTAFNNIHFRQFSTLLRTTFDDACNYFTDKTIDLLHIDGMHTYEVVKHDFEAWHHLLSDKSVVLFHDTNVRERDFGVWRLWQELRERYPSFLFNHSNGLGVLGVGLKQMPAMHALFALGNTTDAAAAFRRRISSRGEAFQRQIELINVSRQLESAKGHIQDLTQRLEVAAKATQAASQDAQNALKTSVEQLAKSADLYRAKLAWQDMLLASKLEIISAKDAILSTIANTSSARAAALATRDVLIKARDALAAKLVVELSDERRVSQKRLERIHQIGAEMEAALQKQQSELHESFRIQLFKATQSIARANLALREQRVELTLAFENSTSWRLTTPVRAVARLLGRGGSNHGHVAPASEGPVDFVSQLPSLESPAPSEPLVESQEVPHVSAINDTASLKEEFRRAQLAKLESFLDSGRSIRLPQSDNPTVSIVLVLFNRAELTFACLSSIVETLATEDIGLEIVVVDNNSTDLTSALLERLEGAIILRNKSNLHYVRAVNQAMNVVTGRNTLLLNNDAILLQGAVASAVKTLQADDTIGAVGGRIIALNGKLQEAGNIIWQDGTCSSYGNADDPRLPEYMFQRDVDYCSAAFLMTPTEVFRGMGGFDERFAPAYYEDTDYCVRLWESGRRVIFDPQVSIVHYEFGSSSHATDALAMQTTNHHIFVAQHGAWLSKQFSPSPLNILHARTARSGAKRLLVLEDRVPKMELGRGYPRSNRLVHEFVKAGANVTFFPMIRFEESWHSVRQALDKRVEVLILAEGSQIRHFLEARRNLFDAIIVCRPHNMETFQREIGVDRDLIGEAAVIYDAEALFVGRAMLKLQQDGVLISDLERHRMVAEEVALTHLADAVTSVNAIEQRVMEDYGARNVRVLGYALDDRPIETTFEQRDQIVFFGGTQTEDSPNADSVRWFVREILPSIRQSLGSDISLTLVGENRLQSFVEMDGSELELVGVVDDPSVALSRARVMVVPARIAAGIPLKVLHGAMLGIPMVVTGLIANQVGWQNKEHFLVADDAKAFSAACVRLYRDPAIWESVRQNALLRVQHEWSPKIFTDAVSTILAELPLVHRRPPPAKAMASQIPARPIELNTSRPAEADFSAAVPFGFLPQMREPLLRIGVICHLFHVEVAREFLFYFANLPVGADLLISTDTEDKRVELQSIFGDWSKGSIETRVVPNRGRDIGPKLVGFADVYDQYDLVLHLHSKKSEHASFLSPWRSFLLENLAGSQAIVLSIMEAFIRLPDLGIVAAQHYEGIRRWIGWDKNFELASSLAKRMGISLSPSRALDFPSGSMFWARPAALKPLLDLRLSFDDFPAETDRVLRTSLAHAIERLYFYACEHSGYCWMKVAQPSLYWDVRTVVDIPTPAALSRFMVERGVMLSGPSAIARLDEPAPEQRRVPPGLRRRLSERGV